MPKPLKLLREDVLKEIAKRHIIKRQPVYRLMSALRDKGIPISQPTLSKLICAYNLLPNDVVYKSLFPPWLEEPMQTQDPYDWCYSGMFPYGEWQSYDVDIKRPNKYKKSRKN